MNSPFKAIALRCIGIGTAIALLGCHPADDGHSRDGLLYCSQGTPSSFNPQLNTSATVVEATSFQLYDRLVDISDDGHQLLPGLAERWDTNDEATVYTFYLRRNVRFHHTDYFSPSRMFNADDVLFSFNRIVDKTHPYHYVGGGEYSFFTSVGLPLMVKSISALDEHTVQFELFAPDSTFITNLATNFSVLLSAEYGEMLSTQGQRHLIDKHPIGTGPYRFYRYKDEQYIKYKRHNDYWKGRPALTNVVYDITPNGTMRLAKLLTGECDVMALPLASDLSLLRSKPSLELQYQSGFNLGYWAFNTEREPFNNPRVRRALSMAVDRAPIMEAVYYGTASPADSLLPPASWAYHSSIDRADFNRTEARKLLTEAGYPNGFSMDIWVMPVQRAYNPNAKKMALLMQENLRAIGVKVNMVTYDWGVFRTKLSQGLHDSVLIGWTADNADPDNFFRPLLSCQAKFAGTNRAMWCDKYFDRLIDNARQSIDLQTRKDLYMQAQFYLNEQMPLVPIAHGMRMQAVRKHIHGLEVEAFGGINFSTVTVE
ncbi:ABC transporter substrate-binding protein [Echinimonas agarilytica]|uniref:ABC transporter substrate-binding protein n=1 Tax=Echinimonas agarilytica TaxID=1215918 RepID=A0AA42B861_9GAMM|nr:ABC transporter substrate-binding protein [Echinimonas agarilytica]